MTGSVAGRSARAVGSMFGITGTLMLHGLLTALGVVALTMAGLTALELRFSSRWVYVNPVDTWPVGVWLACAAVGLGTGGIVRRLDYLCRGCVPRPNADAEQTAPSDPKGR